MNLNEIEATTKAIRAKIEAEGIGAPQKYSWIATAAATNKNPAAAQFINALFDTTGDTILPVQQWIVLEACRPLLTGSPDALIGEAMRAVETPNMTQRMANDYLANNIPKLRHARNMTQKELAIKAGVPLPMIQKYESGARSIYKAATETSIRIANALGVSVEDLFSM